ncbi:hypothetical protein V6N11_034252 [Hibiscus sabdariffa]|uniref:RNase H type-1 domain-containing protein n=1 Tax=Hibiscus sabdariffa TaxID=183260 RepID=A0ABR2N876_9ROSI
MICCLRHSERRRIGNQAININYMLVSGLIDASTKTWKLDVLNDLFDVEHVSKICTIPLSKLGMCDELIWRHDGSGSYTVKSGYRLLCEDVHIVYAKVKITMWKVINNFMPTFANLQSRRLNVNNSWAFCLSASESIDHIMRDCWFVRQVLETQGVQFPTPIVDVDWKDWLVLTFCSLSAKHKIVLMVTFWTTWYARNKAPMEKVIKLTFDAAYDAQSSKSFSGVICRDSVGFIMAGLEGDSLTVIKKVCSKTADVSLISPVIYDIREIAKEFEDVTFCFTHREAHGAAHALAREGK